jgi:exosortase K
LESSAYDLKRLSPYLFYLILFVGLKGFFAFADDADLQFLSAPLAQLLSFFSGYAHLEISSGVYRFPEVEILIDSSCSGYNLFLIYFLLLGWTTISYHSNGAKVLQGLPLNLGVAYLLTLFTNSTRILSLLKFESSIANFFHSSQDLIHQALGAFNNLFFLVLTYLIINHLFKKKYAQPSQS